MACTIGEASAKEPMISHAPAKPTHRELFICFFEAGITGFGAVLPIVRRLAVDEKHWMSQTQFNDLFSLCQLLPGANMVNFAFALGVRERGVGGAVACVIGLLAAPVCIVLMLSAAYARYGGLPQIRHGLAGLAAAAAGLVLSTCMRIATPILSNRTSVALSAVVFILVFVCRLPLPAIIGIMLPVSLALCRRTS